MVEKIGHIKNPLTVIAIFAGIAEISGTIVLPFISEENQATYIWFLMSFPFFLVLVFFLTLNFNHKTLYSPSDYRDENNFLNPIAKATPEESEKKLKREAQEVVEEVKSEETADGTQTGATEDLASPSNMSDDSTTPKVANPSSSAATQSNNSSSVSIEVSDHKRDNLLAAEVVLAEKLAVSELSKKLSLPFKSDARLDLPGYESQVFSALATHGRTVHALQVKVFPGNRLDSNRLVPLIKEARDVQMHLTNNGYWESLILHIFIVTSASPAAIDELSDDMKITAYNNGVNLRIHTYDHNDLRNFYQYG